MVTQDIEVFTREEVERVLDRLIDHFWAQGQRTDRAAARDLALFTSYLGAIQLTRLALLGDVKRLNEKSGYSGELVERFLRLKVQEIFGDGGGMDS